MIRRRNSQRWRNSRNLSISIPERNITQILRTPTPRQRSPPSPPSPRSPINVKKKLFSTSSDGIKILKRIKLV